MAEAVGLERVSKRYGAVVALDDVTVTVQSGALAAVLGPSGCGKSSLLHAIAGLVRPDSGEVRLNEKAVASDIPPEARGLGMMFQAPTLFPHMNVFENVAFPLRVRGKSDAEVNSATQSILELADLADYSRASPKTLSGGQQQRVALCRALVFRPSVVLLDEPLSSLDRPLRESMQRELRKMQRATSATFIMVTHDREEAMALADVIFVMREGRIEQSGTPPSLYRAPVNRFVAEFFGGSTVLRGTIRANGNQWSVVNGDGLTLYDSSSAAPSSGEMDIAIKPEDVRVSRNTSIEPAQNGDCLGRVEEVRFTGPAVMLVLACPSTRLLARIDADDAEEWIPGDNVRISVNSGETVPIKSHSAQRNQ